MAQEGIEFPALIPRGSLLVLTCTHRGPDIIPIVARTLKDLDFQEELVAFCRDTLGEEEFDPANRDLEEEFIDELINQGFVRPLNFYQADLGEYRLTDAIEDEALRQRLGELLSAYYRRNGQEGLEEL